MIPLEDECLVEAKLKPVTILAKVDKIWIIDPDPNVVNPWLDLWLLGKKLVCELEWDPMEWTWLPTSCLGEDVRTILVFQYSVRLGKEMIRIGCPIPLSMFLLFEENLFVSVLKALVGNTGCSTLMLYYHVKENVLRKLMWDTTYTTRLTGIQQLGKHRQWRYTVCEIEAEREQESIQNNGALYIQCAQWALFIQVLKGLAEVLTITSMVIDELLTLTPKIIPSRNIGLTAFRLPVDQA